MLCAVCKLQGGCGVCGFMIVNWGYHKYTYSNHHPLLLFLLLPPPSPPPTPLAPPPLPSDPPSGVTVIESPTVTIDSYDVIHRDDVLYHEASSLEIVNEIYHTHTTAPSDVTQSSIYHEPMTLATPDLPQELEGHYEVASPYEQPVASISAIAASDTGDYEQPTTASVTMVYHPILQSDLIPLLQSDTFVNWWHKHYQNDLTHARNHIYALFCPFAE